MPTPSPTLRDRLGGRWALSWQASVLGSVLISVLFVVRGSALAAPGKEFAAAAQWLLVALVAVAIKSAWQVLADRTFLRSRRVSPLPVGGVLLFDMSVGVVFGAASIGAEVLIDPLGDEISSAEAGLRIAAFALTTVCWYVITTILFDARQRFWDERERLLGELVQTQLAQVQEQKVIESLREEVKAELKEPLAQAQLATATALLEEGAEPSGIADQLRELASGSVRSLSHELHEDEERAYPRSSFLTVMRSFSREARFAVIPVLLMIAVAYLIDATIRNAAQVGVVSTLGFAAVCAALMLVANLAMDRLPAARLLVYAITFVLLEVIAFLYVSGVTPWAWWTGALDVIPLTAGEVAALVLIVTVGLLGTTYAAAVMTHRAQVLARLRADADDAVAEQLAMAQRLSDASRIIASDLHGTLQTRLMVCAGALDRARADGDPTEVRAALDQAWRVLRTPFSDAEDGASVREVIDLHVARWDGLLDVTCRVDPAVLGAGDEVADRIGVVLEEGLANAYRHGGASRAEAEIGLEGTTVMVRVTDDGTGPSASDDGAGPAAGMGSRRMAAVGDVTLERVPTGTLLTVRLPAGPAS